MNECGNPVGEELDEILEETDETSALEREDEILAENDSSYIKMDFSLESPEERKKKVEEIIANTPSDRLTPKYLEKLADYIIFAMDKEERKQKKILTENRMITVNKRETSFEGLVGKLENGEDGIYNMIANDKNIIFQPKAGITNDDLEAIPELKSLYDEILKIEEKSKNARGSKAYALKKMVIEMRQDQYVIKGSFKKPIRATNIIKSATKMNLDENITVTAEGDVESNGFINFYNEQKVSAILCNYSKLKEDSWDKLNDDLKWLMEDFDSLVDNTLKEKFPLYYDLLIYKIDGKQNIEIQDLLFQKYGIRHSVEYISSLWRNKIPKLIVEEAKNEWLVWHFTFEDYGKWKKCGRCGQVKLAHSNFFSKNRTSRDGWYSLCKECRKKKNKM